MMRAIQDIDMVREFEILAARAPFVDAIKNAPDRFARLDAIHAFYGKAWEEIKAAPACDWSIDPYEAGLDAYMTPIEAGMWHDLRAEGIVVYPQYPVGRFFVDFGNPVAKVALECDGAAFHQDWRKDAERDRQINALGWSVYRFTGKECLQDFIETVDEDGNEFIEASPMRKRLREIAAIHGISRKFL